MTQRSKLEKHLVINPDELDDCLVEQPSFFYHVAEAVAQANARRDSAKLDLEEATAQLDQDVRAELTANNEKFTEGSIQARLRTMPKLQKLQDEYLNARTEAEHWLALKEAFQQRSFMLRELVALQISQLQGLGIERGAGANRQALGSAARQRSDADRRERRLSNQ